MKIILASKSGVRKEILDTYKIDCDVIVSNVDEDEVKNSLLGDGADPLLISKNLAELKSIKVSNKNPDRLVLGADSVISFNNELINKPKSRDEALKILKKLNNSKHFLVSSACISKNGSMIWNHSDTSELKMKKLSEESGSNFILVNEFCYFHCTTIFFFIHFDIINFLGIFWKRYLHPKIAEIWLHS